MTMFRILVVVLITISQPALAEETLIGRWCDQMIPTSNAMNGELKLVILDSGQMELRSLFFDGSNRIQKLEDLSGGVFHYIGSNYGETITISPSTGELFLADNDGLIRIARRLEIAPQSNDCLK